jgi:hypothetical protein
MCERDLIVGRNGTGGTPSGKPVVSASALGLVDGQVTTVLGQDDSISMHVVIGTSGLRDEEHADIEFVLDREHARILGQALLDACWPRGSPAACETPPVSCCVGIRVNFTLLDW